MNQLKCKQLQMLCSYILQESYFFYCNPHKNVYNFIKDCFQTTRVGKLAEISRNDDVQ